MIMLWQPGEAVDSMIIDDCVSLGKMQLNLQATAIETGSAESGQCNASDTFCWVGRLEMGLKHHTKERDQHKWIPQVKVRMCGCLVSWSYPAFRCLVWGG